MSVWIVAIPNDLPRDFMARFNSHAKKLAAILPSSLPSWALWLGTSFTPHSYTQDAGVCVCVVCPLVSFPLGGSTRLRSFYNPATSHHRSFHHCPSSRGCKRPQCGTLALGQGRLSYRAKSQEHSRYCAGVIRRPRPPACLNSATVQLFP